MRYFLGLDGGGIIRQKHAFGGDDAKTPALVAGFLSDHPGWTAQEVILAAFDIAVAVVDPTPDRAVAVDTFLNNSQPISKIERGAALVTMDEINLLRQWVVSFKAQVALATTLADLKTRVAALSDLPDRIASQIKSAIQNKINAGIAD